MKNWRQATAALLLILLALASPAYAGGNGGPAGTQGIPQTIIYNSLVFPHDWTEGTGVMPSGGVITIPAPVYPKKRQWIYIQNQSAITITVEYEARLANGTTQVFPPILLGPGTASGTQGGGDERGFSLLAPQGIVKVIGTAGSQVNVTELVE